MELTSNDIRNMLDAASYLAQADESNPDEQEQLVRLFALSAIAPWFDKSAPPEYQCFAQAHNAILAECAEYESRMGY